MNIGFIEDNYALWERQNAFSASGITPEFMLTRWESTMDLYAAALIKLGNQCVKFVPSLSSGHPEDFTHDLGHRVVKVPCLKGVSSLLSRLDWRISARTFTSQVEKQDFMRSCDIAHYHSFYSSYFLASPALRGPKRITAHYTGGRFPSEMSFPRRPLALRLLRRALARANGILLDDLDLEAKEQAEFLSERMGVPPGKIFPFPTIMVDLKKFKDQNKVEARRKLKLSPGALIIVSPTAVGDEPPELDMLAKNPFRLLKIFSEVLKVSSANIELHVLGGGAGVGALRSLSQSLGISNAVSVRGVVSHEAVADFIAASDVAFVPYNFEDLTFGSVVFEAFACRRPVGGFKRTNSIETERPGGFLVDRDDRVAANQILDRISDPGYLSQKADEGARIAASRSPDSLGPSLDSVFRKVLSGDGHPS